MDSVEFLRSFPYHEPGCVPFKATSFISHVQTTLTQIDFSLFHKSLDENFLKAVLNGYDDGKIDENSIKSEDLDL